jgi:cell division protein FtsN
MKKQLVPVLVISAILSVAGFNAFAAEDAPDSKVQTKVRPHSHPVEKGIVPPASEQRQAPVADQKKENKDAQKDKVKKHYHPTDAK